MCLVIRKFYRISINLAEANHPAKSRRIRSDAGISVNERSTTSNPYFEGDFQKNVRRLKNACFTIKESKRGKNDRPGGNTQPSGERYVVTHPKVAAQEFILPEGQVGNTQTCFLPQVVKQVNVSKACRSSNGQSYTLPHIRCNHQPRDVGSRSGHKVDGSCFTARGSSGGKTMGYDANSLIRFPVPAVCGPTQIQAFSKSNVLCKQLTKNVPPLGYGTNEYNKLLERRQRLYNERDGRGEFALSGLDRRFSGSGLNDRQKNYRSEICIDTARRAESSLGSAEDHLAGYYEDNEHQYGNDVEYIDGESADEESLYDSSDGKLSVLSIKSKTATVSVRTASKQKLKQSRRGLASPRKKQRVSFAGHNRTVFKKSPRSRRIIKTERATSRNSQTSVNRHECPEEEINARHERLAQKMASSGVWFDDFEVIPGGDNERVCLSRESVEERDNASTYTSTETSDTEISDCCSDKAAAFSQLPPISSIDRIGPSRTPLGIRQDSLTNTKPGAPHRDESLKLEQDGWNGEAADIGLNGVDQVKKTSNRFNPNLDGMGKVCMSETDDSSLSRKSNSHANIRGEGSVKKRESGCENIEKADGKGKGNVNRLKSVRFEQSCEVDTKSAKFEADNNKNQGNRAESLKRTSPEGAKHISMPCRDHDQFMLQNSRRISENDVVKTSDLKTNINLQNDKNNHASKFDKIISEPDGDEQSYIGSTVNSKCEKHSTVIEESSLSQNGRKSNVSEDNAQTLICQDKEIPSKSNQNEKGYQYSDSDGVQLFHSSVSQVVTSSVTLSCCFDGDTENGVATLSATMSDVSSDTGAEIPALKDENVGRSLEPVKGEITNSNSDATYIRSIEGDLVYHNKDNPPSVDGRCSGDGDEETLVANKEELFIAGAQSEEIGRMINASYTKLLPTEKCISSFCEKVKTQAQVSTIPNECMKIQNTERVIMNEIRSPPNKSKETDANLRSLLVGKPNAKDKSELETDQPTNLSQNRFLDKEYRLVVRDVANSILGEAPFMGKSLRNSDRDTINRSIKNTSNADCHNQFLVPDANSTDSPSNSPHKLQDSSSEQQFHVSHGANPAEEKRASVFIHSEATNITHNDRSVLTKDSDLTTVAHSDVHAKQNMENSMVRLCPTELDIDDELVKSITYYDSDDEQNIFDDFNHDDVVKGKSPKSCDVNVGQETLAESKLTDPVSANTHLPCTSKPSIVSDDTHGQVVLEQSTSNASCNRTLSANAVPLTHERIFYAKQACTNDGGEYSLSGEASKDENILEDQVKTANSSPCQTRNDNADSVSGGDNAEKHKETPTTVSVSTAPNSLNAPNNSPCEESCSPCALTLETKHSSDQGESKDCAETSSSDITREENGATPVPYEDGDVLTGDIVAAASLGVAMGVGSMGIGLSQRPDQILSALESHRSSPRCQYYSSGSLLVPSFVVKARSRRTRRAEQGNKTLPVQRKEPIPKPMEDRGANHLDVHISGSKMKLRSKPKAFCKSVYIAPKPKSIMVNDQLTKAAGGTNEYPKSKIANGPFKKPIFIPKDSVVVPPPQKEHLLRNSRPVVSNGLSQKQQLGEENKMSMKRKLPVTKHLQNKLKAEATTDYKKLTVTSKRGSGIRTSTSSSFRPDNKNSKPKAATVTEVSEGSLKTVPQQGRTKPKTNYSGYQSVLYERPGCKNATKSTVPLPNIRRVSNNNNAGDMIIDLKDTHFLKTVQSKSKKYNSPRAPPRGSCDNKISDDAKIHRSIRKVSEKNNCSNSCERSSNLDDDLRRDVIGTQTGKSSNEATIALDVSQPCGQTNLLQDNFDGDFSNNALVNDTENDLFREKQDIKTAECEEGGLSARDEQCIRAIRSSGSIINVSPKASSKMSMREFALSDSVAMGVNADESQLCSGYPPPQLEPVSPVTENCLRPSVGDDHEGVGRANKQPHRTPVSHRHDQSVHRSLFPSSFPNAPSLSNSEKYSNYTVTVAAECNNSSGKVSRVSPTKTEPTVGDHRNQGPEALTSPKQLTGDCSDLDDDDFFNRHESTKKLTENFIVSEFTSRKDKECKEGSSAITCAKRNLIETDGDTNQNQQSSQKSFKCDTTEQPSYAFLKAKALEKVQHIRAKTEVYKEPSAAENTALLHGVAESAKSEICRYMDGFLAGQYPDLSVLEGESTNKAGSRTAIQMGSANSEISKDTNMATAQLIKERGVNEGIVNNDTDSLSNSKALSYHACVGTDINNSMAKFICREDSKMCFKGPGSNNTPRQPKRYENIDKRYSKEKSCERRSHRRGSKIPVRARYPCDPENGVSQNLNYREKEAKAKKLPKNVVMVMKDKTGLTVAETKARLDYKHQMQPEEKSLVSEMSEVSQALSETSTNSTSRNHNNMVVEVCIDDLQTVSLSNSDRTNEENDNHVPLECGETNFRRHIDCTPPLLPNQEGYCAKRSYLSRSKSSRSCIANDQDCSIVCLSQQGRHSSSERNSRTTKITTKTSRFPTETGFSDIRKGRKKISSNSALGSKNITTTKQFECQERQTKHRKLPDRTGFPVEKLRKAHQTQALEHDPYKQHIKLAASGTATNTRQSSANMASKRRHEATPCKGDKQRLDTRHSLHQQRHSRVNRSGTKSNSVHRLPKVVKPGQCAGKIQDDLMSRCQLFSPESARSRCTGRSFLCTPCYLNLSYHFSLTCSITIFSLPGIEYTQLFIILLSLLIIIIVPTSLQFSPFLRSLN